MLITIFTPTYNRAHTLERLYQSLKNQTTADFEWLIVDDGSTDNTESLISGYIAEKVIPIQYIKTENRGKSSAVNTGVRHAGGELFFIVDSDDYIMPTAIKQICKSWDMLDSKELYAGLCFRKENYSTQKIIGHPFPKHELKSNSLEMAYKYGIMEDKAEVFATEVLKKYPFPSIPGEKFVPEAYIWNKIAEKYSLYYVDESIYMCDYLEDGYSKNFKKNLQNNPEGFLLYYKDLLHYKEVPFTNKLKAFIRIIQLKHYKRCKRRS